VTKNTIDWDYRKKLDATAAAATSAPAASAPAATVAHKVIHVHSEEEYNKWKATPNKLVVVDFAAVWCEPCKRFAPIFEKFAGEYSGAVFLHVDIDELKNAQDVQGVSSLPAFKFFKNGQIVAECVGSNTEHFEANIKQHY